MRPEPDPAPVRDERIASGLARHGPGFLASGLIAFTVDAGLTSLLTRVAGVSAYAARPVAIAIAMVVAWACHRRLTFKVAGPPTLAEFGRYAAVAWAAAALNYVVYAAILVTVPALPIEVVLAGATAVAMVASYAGMRFGVFTKL
jgi:putative flippase GtrA